MTITTKCAKILVSKIKVREKEITMGEFFMWLSTSLGLGVGGVYIVFGVVVIGLIATGVGAYVAHRRKKNLKQGVVSKVANKVKGALGKEQSGEFVEVKVRDDKRYNNFLNEQPENVQGDPPGGGPGPKGSSAAASVSVDEVLKEDAKEKVVGSDRQQVFNEQQTSNKQETSKKKENKKANTNKGFDFPDEAEEESEDFIENNAKIEVGRTA